MRNILTKNRSLLVLMAGALAIVVLAIGCAPSEDPFNFGDRAASQANPVPTIPAELAGTPVPTIPLEEAAKAAEEAGQRHLESLFEETIGSIKIGEWKDNKERQLQNFIAGYIMVYGYDYGVELVDTSDSTYQEALKKGDLDLVLQAEQSWVEAESDSGLVVDAGTIHDASTDMRIGVYGAIKQNAPEIMEFLGKMKPGDELIAELASKITGGRTGIKPNVAALMYFKNHPEIWSQWIPASVADKVDAAIKAGKTSLVNRKCIPGGGSGSGSPNCGT